jgi:hypothetical protein
MNSRRGLTIVELVIASGLASLLMVAVFQLIDTTLGVWNRGETRRNLIEQAAGVAGLLTPDLRAIHGGQQGDFLAEWEVFDTDGDELRDRPWPRLRLVRQGSAREIARLRAGTNKDQPDTGLIEVVWAVLPVGKGAATEGLLWRGERLYTEATDKDSFFDPGFFAPTGKPKLGAMHEVTAGVLWMGMQFATQTSIIHGGWKPGDQLADTAHSWDAWNRLRPDPEFTPWNEPGAGMPEARGKPLLPRRVRIELEFERAKDVKMRTALAAGIDQTASTLQVVDGGRIPKRDGVFLLVGTEWMELKNVQGDSVSVRRAARGTERQIHGAGEIVHHGQTVITEIPVDLYSDDWNL